MHTGASFVLMHFAPSTALSQLCKAGQCSLTARDLANIKNLIGPH